MPLPIFSNNPGPYFHKREALPGNAPTGPESGPKRHKTTTSAAQEAIKVLEKEADDALKALRYEQLREALKEVKALKAQGWTIDDKGVARNQGLEAKLSTLATVEWWINNCDIDQGQLIRNVKEYPDDAGFSNCFEELIQDMMHLVVIDRGWNEMDRREPEKRGIPNSEEMVQMQQYFNEHELVWEL